MDEIVSLWHVMVGDTENPRSSEGNDLAVCHRIQFIPLSASNKAEEPKTTEEAAGKE